MASLLTESVSVRQGDYWRDWNADHPNRASVLWPVVQRLASRELYVLIPELLLIARSLPGDDLAKPLSDQIDGWLVVQYGEIIDDLRDADRLVLADELLREALLDYPNAPELDRLKRSDG